MKDGFTDRKTKAAEAEGNAIRSPQKRKGRPPSYVARALPCSGRSGQGYKARTAEQMKQANLDTNVIPVQHVDGSH